MRLRVRQLLRLLLPGRALERPQVFRTVTRVVLLRVSRLPRLVAHVVEIMVSQRVGHVTNWWKAQVGPILVVPVIVRVIVVDWCLPLVVASAIELSVVRLAGISMDLTVKRLLVLSLRVLSVVAVATVHRPRRSHLCADVLRWRINLDADFVNAGVDQLRRLDLRLLIPPLLLFHEGNVVLPRDAFLASLVVFPRRVRDLLHLQKCIWRDFVLSLRVLVLLVQVLPVVFFRIHQTNVLFQFLDERLWEWLCGSRSILVDSIHRQQELDKDVLPKNASFASAVLEDHQAEAILNAAVPEPAVDAAVGPVHLTVALFHVVVVVTLVVAA